MAETAKSRAEMHRINQEEKQKYRGFLGFSIFILISVVFIMGTFLNPQSMKREIAKDSNVGIINRVINDKFDNFAVAVGADKESDRNLLRSTQTLPIANEMIDYSLGFHGFKTSTDQLSEKIQHILLTKIDDNSSDEAQRIQELTNKSKRTSRYAIDSGFNLPGTMILANGVTLGWIIGFIIIILSLIMIVSIIKKLTVYYQPRQIVHNFFNSSLFAGAAIIIVFGIVSLIPSFISLDNLLQSGFGTVLTLGSGKFLELVIVGVGLLIISIIPWAASK